MFTPERSSAKNALASFAVFSAVLIFLFLSGRDRGGLRIDEAHKIADTYFFHLLRTGEFSHSDWFRHIADRTNPPVGKFLFGLSASISGATLPADLSLREELPDGSLGQRLEGEPNRFDDVLRAARRVSMIATAGTAAVVFSAAAFAGGPAAGVIAVSLYLAHYLTTTFSATAVYDPLLTFFIALSSLPLAHLLPGTSRGRLLLSAVAAGIFGAAAFQTRLSGLLGIAVLLAIYLLMWIVTRRRELLLFVAIAAAILVLIAAAVNPFYWAVPAPGSRPVIGSEDVLPLRIMSRFGLQLAELSELLDRQSRDQEMLGSVASKSRFAAEIMLGDLTGMLALLGWGIAIFFMTTGRSDRRAEIAAVFAWSGLIITLLIIWIPLAWPRYMLAAIPALAIGGGIGWGELIGAARQFVGSERSRQYTGDRRQ